MENNEILKRCRIMKGLSSSEAAKKLGMNIKTYYRWEQNGLNEVRLINTLQELGIGVNKTKPVLTIEIEGFDIMSFELE